ncbi:MAG: FkbM family methyltransferase [Pseudomonadota bacterium]|nr:FkbM family methyltransferase [Pseudomonadota bacterium]
MSDDQTLVEAPFRLSEILGMAAYEEIEVLDVGAMVEGRPRYEALSRQGLCRVTGFEINQAEIPAVEAALPHGSKVLPYALGDGRQATLHVTLYRGCSSLFEPNPDVIELFASISTTWEDGNFRVVDRVQVETHRLDDIESCPPPDYAKFDIQGAELMVMENGMEKLARAVVIETEVEFLEIYKGQPLFSDIQSFLKRHGFVLHKMVDIEGRNFRPMLTDYSADATSQFLWADAVFVRDFSRLDLFSTEQFLKAAVILHEVYFSYDLALLFLYAHDLTKGSTFSDAYRAKLSTFESVPRQFATIRTHN